MLCTGCSTPPQTDTSPAHLSIHCVTCHSLVYCIYLHHLYIYCQYQSFLSSHHRLNSRFPTRNHKQQNKNNYAVLGRFVHSLNAFCMEEYGLEYQVSDYHIYDFAKVWRCSQDESNHKVHEFFKSYHFSAGIEVIPGAFEALLRLRSECELVVVTSRQHVIQEPTMEWLNTHFPSIFEAVHFGNHFALEGKSRKKSEICHAIGAHVLIDDNPNYAMECAAAGINVLLYDWEHSYPWSKTPDGPVHERITRVRDWDEVEQVLGILSSMSTTNGASSSAAAADVFEVPPCSSSASALLPPSSSSS